MNKEMINHELLGRIMEIDHTEIEGKLVVKLTIPMLENKKYTLYKPHLTPFNKKGKFEAYEVDTEFIAWNRVNDDTIELDKTNIDECKTIKEDQDNKLKICEHNKPILPIANSHCISNLLTSNFVNTKLCKTFEVEPMNTIMKLHSRNTWLYSLSHSIRVAIQCKNSTQTITLTGTGTLTFMTRCKLITEEFVIEVAGFPKIIKLEQPKTQESVNQFNEINFNIDTNIKDEESIGKVSKIKIKDSEVFYKEISKEAGKIRDIKERAQEIKMNNQSIGIDMIKTNSITGISIVIVITVIYVAIKKCRVARIARTTINIKSSKDEDEVKMKAEPISKNTREMNGIRII